MASKGPQADLQGVATVFDCQVLDDIPALCPDSGLRLVGLVAEGCFLFHEVTVAGSETDWPLLQLRRAVQLP